MSDDVQSPPKFQTKIPRDGQPLIFHGVELKSPFEKSAPYTTLEVGEVLIVLYTDSNGLFMLRNVCAFDKRGNVLWILEPLSEPGEHFPEYFISLSGDERTGHVYVSTSDDTSFQLNIASGEKFNAQGGRWSAREPK